MKDSMLIVAPVGTRSGYGDHARDLFHSFYDLDRWDIKVIDVRWGDTPRNALDENNEKDKLIIDRIISLNEPLTKQPDICVDIRIPNEFTPIGKFNIGITAGIETHAVSAKWLEDCNKMDLIIVPSEHSKNGFIYSKYDKMQDTPDGKQQKIGDLTLEKPIEVLFEGVNENIYKSVKNANLDLVDDIPEDFAFLFVGQWVKGEYGEDRKDIGRMIHNFYETFFNTKNPPALILKTSGATFSIMDREEIKSKILSIKEKFPTTMGSLPNVYLLHGDLSKEELNSLYNHPKVKAMVSFTHGEGFGRPLLEATMTGLPVMASAWSGQMDFLLPDYSVLIKGSLDKVPPSATWKDIIIPESQWFTADMSDASKNFNFIFKQYNSVKRSANKLMEINREKFTHSKMTEKLGEIVDKYLKEQPKKVGLNLPKLTKVKKDNTIPANMAQEKPRVKLPKLNKVGV